MYLAFNKVANIKLATSLKINSYAGAYWEPSQMKVIVKVVSGFNRLTILAQTSS